MTTVTRTYEAQVSAEGEWLSVTQVCRASQIDFDVVIELAELGLEVLEATLVAHVATHRDQLQLEGRRGDRVDVERLAVGVRA